MHHTLIIKKLERLPGEVTLVFFEDLPFSYQPGQFLTFIVQSGKNSVRRSFSLTSIPGEEPCICVKRIPNGLFSRYIYDTAKPGDKLLCTGASGFFQLPGTPAEELVFFAAGSGIAPVFALIKYALRRFDTPVRLIYSSRSPELTIFRNELNGLKDAHPDRLHISYLFSNSPVPESSRLQYVLLQKILDELKKDSVFYFLCGPVEYMRMIVFTLKLNGIADKYIRTEKFFQHEPLRVPEPPNKEKHRVQIEIGSTYVEMDVQYPESILKIAKKKNVPVPYSCEWGRCGSCVAKCISGSVWMSVNEVLTEKEISNGYVLTCTGYPLSDCHLKID